MLHLLIFLTRCYKILHSFNMPLIINDISYLTTTDILENLDITRQTLWRWRQEGKIPSGHRFRGRQVLFTPNEVEEIQEYATRIEPIEHPERKQIGLFNHLENKESE